MRAPCCCEWKCVFAIFMTIFFINDDDIVDGGINAESAIKISFNQ